MSEPSSTDASCLPTRLRSRGDPALRVVKSIAATILLVAGFPAPTTASDSPECTPDQAFIELQERARAGSADARYWVAVSQLTGANCQEQDPRRAAESFSQAARMGHVKARHELANLKLYRLDPPEPAEGIALLRQNVELGHMESATTLGKSTNKGRVSRANQTAG